MGEMKSMEQIFKEEIDNLIEQRDYTRELLNEYLRYQKSDVDRLNAIIGDYNYRIGHYRRLLDELKEEKRQHAQISQ